MRRDGGEHANGRADDPHAYSRPFSCTFDKHAESSDYGSANATSD